MTAYYAHSENEQNQWHFLTSHLQDVAKLAKEFAEKTNPQLEEAVYWSGLLHDVGKYRDEFQQYLNKQRESSLETHHAVYGAALAFQNEWLAPSFAIAGHHAGLHDLSQLQALVDVENSKYHLEERLPLIKERFEKEIFEIVSKIKEPAFAKEKPLITEFYIRMLFSILIDADFLDTEFHYEGKHRQILNLDKELSQKLLQRIIQEKESKPQVGKLNHIRNQLFQQCLDKAEYDKGFFSLTVPTGGGKTLSAMAFALAHAKRHSLRRVIVVIPYLSIIEQNAAQYKRILDPDNLGIVIEHHSAIKIADDSNETRTDNPFQKHPEEYAAENWDAPIIVTTSVQFIESLFAYRTSRCRKLHNIAQSVVVFDEVQTLPTHLLNPLLSVFRDLHQHYDVSFVFSTATQPAFRQDISSLNQGFNENEIQEISGNPQQLFDTLKRTQIHLPKNNKTLSWDKLAETMASNDYKQGLAIVNVRNDAFMLWEKLRTCLTEKDKDSVFHLSSAMCAEHRFDILGNDKSPAPNTIRYRLLNKYPCFLVSTQLIEAGVDVDFPVVWRAFAPLDSIIQAAGRCNRENKLKDEKGDAKLGDVFVFLPEDNKLPKGIYKTATDLTASLLAKYNFKDNDLVADPELFSNYFSQLYQYVPTDSDIQIEREQLHFREVAKLAKVIKTETQAIIVPYGKAIELIDEVQNRSIKRGQARFKREDQRKLQRFMVNLQMRDFYELQSQGAIQSLLPNLSVYVLNEGWYHLQLGVIINNLPTEDYIL